MEKLGEVLRQQLRKNQDIYGKIPEGEIIFKGNNIRRIGEDRFSLEFLIEIEPNGTSDNATTSKSNNITTSPFASIEGLEAYLKENMKPILFNVDARRRVTHRMRDESNYYISPLPHSITDDFDKNGNSIDRGIFDYMAFWNDDNKNLDMIIMPILTYQLFTEEMHTALKALYKNRNTTKYSPKIEGISFPAIGYDQKVARLYAKNSPFISVMRVSNESIADMINADELNGKSPDNDIVLVKERKKYTRKSLEDSGVKKPRKQHIGRHQKYFRELAAEKESSGESVESVVNELSEHKPQDTALLPDGSFPYEDLVRSSEQYGLMTKFVDINKTSTIPASRLLFLPVSVVKQYIGIEAYKKMDEDYIIDKFCLMYTQGESSFNMILIPEENLKLIKAISSDGRKFLENFNEKMPLLVKQKYPSAFSFYSPKFLRTPGSNVNFFAEDSFYIRIKKVNA